MVRAKQNFLRPYAYSLDPDLFYGEILTCMGSICARIILPPFETAIYSEVRSCSYPLGGTSFHLELSPFQKEFCVLEINEEVMETVFLRTKLLKILHSLSIYLNAKWAQSPIRTFRHVRQANI